MGVFIDIAQWPIRVYSHYLLCGHCRHILIEPRHQDLPVTLPELEAAIDDHLHDCPVAIHMQRQARRR